MKRKEGGRERRIGRKGGEGGEGREEGGTKIQANTVKGRKQVRTLTLSSFARLCASKSARQYGSAACRFRVYMEEKNPRPRMLR